jgi:hypothetical protein
MTVGVSGCNSTGAAPESGLICALGACRKECMAAADCISFGAGSSCIDDSNGNAIGGTACAMCPAGHPSCNQIGQYDGINYGECK